MPPIEENSLVDIGPEPAGANCPAGGEVVRVGIDDNRNGTLDAAEIDETRYVCDDAAAPLVTRFDAEPPGPNCAAGGTAIRAGLDLDGDLALDDAEVVRVEYVCAPLVRLTRIETEPAGANCPGGGVAARSGEDLDGDGVLADDEVTATSFFCDGVIDGPLVITSDTDLAQLADIKVVTGKLSICAPVVALPALQIAGGISAIGCPELTSLSLPALHTASAEIAIAGNAALVTLDLGALRHAGDINILDNGALNALEFDALERVHGQILLVDLSLDSLVLGNLETAARLLISDIAAPSLELLHLGQIEDLVVRRTSFTSFSAPALRFAGTALIALNANLASVDLSSLAFVHGDIAIGDSQTGGGNDALTTFSAPQLQSVMFTARIEENATLTSVSMPALRSVGRLSVADNNALTTISAGQLEAAGRFNWSGNNAIQNLGAFGALRRVDLVEITNTPLQRLGLPNLHAARHLVIDNLPQLVSLDLPDLFEVDALVLRGAPAAIRFDTPALVAIREFLEIATSPSLPTCRATQLLAQLVVEPAAIAVSGTDDEAPCP